MTNSVSRERGIASAKSFADANRHQIEDLIARYGHILDGKEWDRLGEIFTEDFTMDASSAGLRTIHGLSELRDWWSGEDANHPIAHHATNIVVEPIVDSATDDARASLLSKGITIFMDDAGATTVSSIVYEDIVTRTQGGWRISSRRVTRRGAAQQPKG